MISIVAPAGSGKTTALFECTYHEQRPVSWLTLDERENDHRRFWRYVVHSLAQHTQPGVEDRTLPLMTEFSEGAMISFLEQLLNELDQEDQPLAIVLDDYHLIHNSEVHEYLNFFIDNLPESVCIYIASRTELPFSGMARWKMNGDVQTIGPQELAFDEVSAAQLCENLLGYPLSEDAVEKLVQRTEGWAAGLQLVLLSMQQGGQDHLSNYVQIRGNQRHLADYLFHEVMAGLDQELQQFLLRTSILKRLNGNICRIVTGQEDSGIKLELIKEKGLFLIPMDVHREWYRYHHLFADYLVTALQQQMPDQWRDLHIRASTAYAQEGWMEEAIDYALLGERYELASDLLDRHVGDVIGQGDFGTLLGWFKQLPDSYELPFRLLLLQAFVHSATSDFMKAKALLDQCEARLSHSSEDETNLEWVSGLFFVKANLAFSSGQFEDWFSFADNIQERLPKDSVFFNFNYNLREPFVRNTSFGLKGVITDTTKKIGMRIVSILEQHGWGDSLICQYVVQALAEGFYEWGELDACANWLNRMIAGNRYREVPGLLIPYRLTLAKLKLSEDQPLAARAIVLETIQTVQEAENGYVHWLRPLRVFLAYLDLEEGNIDEAEVILQDLKISMNQRVTLDHALEILTLARLLIARKANEQALVLLTALRVQAEEAGIVNLAISSIVLQARAELGRSGPMSAAVLLQQALRMGEPFRYCRTFLDEGEWMIKLIRYGLDSDSNLAGHGAESWMIYASGLLEIASVPLKAKMESGDLAVRFGLTPKEQQIITLLYRGQTNQGIADELGLTLGTVKVYLNRIYSKLGVGSRVQALIKTQELVFGQGE
ncbi:LuxR C-terminal-related transcriptional regulator [Fontibacillus phaseoli]|uniref:LuxR C-terminal-related transcriptional regulator n=1 Tax=Fontibacillus phaseoli TaxID=1416533 RepID=UPI001FE41474|nr:LuxR C-terminal-related transcriptional regulator [Fontibacillus phaseoli]